MRALRVLRRRAADERGFTLIELVIVLAILGTVLSSLTVVFVSALRTEVDQTKRFEAQQNARLALVTMRGEIHCAKDATVGAGGTSVTLTSAHSTVTETAYCRAGTSSWCAVPAGSGFSLYRQAGSACDATGRLVAEHLTSGAVFQLIQVAGSRAKVGVDIRVDHDPADARREYRLVDEIVLRGSARA